MPDLENDQAAALPAALAKLKDYLADALTKRFDPSSRYVFVATSDLSGSVPMYGPSLDYVVWQLALYLVGGPVTGNESSQDAARAALKQKFPIVYANYIKSSIKNVNDFLQFDTTQSLLIYGYTDWAERIKIMSLDEYIQRLKDRMQQEGIAPD